MSRYRQKSLDQAGAALGDEQFQRAYARGLALSFDQAISLALVQVHPATQPVTLSCLNRRATTTHERHRDGDRRVR
jgi:hypothetical protein